MTGSIRVGAAAGLLAVEGVALSMFVDLEPLRRASTGVAWLGWGGEFLAFAIAFGVAAAAVLPPRFWADLGPPGRPLCWRLAHGAAVLALAVVLLALAVAPSVGLAVTAAGLGGATALTGLGAFVDLSDLGRGVFDQRARAGLALALGLVGLGLGLAADRVWSVLGHATLVGAAHLLQAVRSDVVILPDERVLGAGGFEVIVSATCSGVEGLGLATVLVVGYLLTYRSEHGPWAWLAWPAALLAVFGGNILRIALLVQIGADWSPAVAIGGFHSKAGWLFFALVGLATLALLRRARSGRPGSGRLGSGRLGSGRLGSGRAGAGSDGAGSDGAGSDGAGSDGAGSDGAEPLGTSPAFLHLAPLVALLGAAMVGGLFESGFPSSYPFALAFGLGVTAYAAPRAGAFRCAPAWVEAAAAGVLAWAVWVLLLPEADPAAVQAQVDRLNALAPELRWGWLFARVVGSVLVVPVAEELAFRGYLMRRLGGADLDAVDPRRIGAVPILVSSFAFGLAHSTILAGVAAGLVYALIYRRRGNLADAIVAHAITNGLIAIEVLGLGVWSRWF